MNKELILLAIISFIIALLWKAPATLLTSNLQKNNPDLSITGVTGRFWSGKAEQLHFQQTDLGKVSWTLNPLGLLSATFKGHFNVSNPELNAEGDFSLGLNNVLLLQDTSFNVSGKWVNQFQQAAKLGGQFRGNIAELELQQDEVLELPLVNGVLNWEKGSLSSPISLPDGNYQLTITPDNEGKLTGNLISNNAPIELSGNITLDKKWQYATDLKIKTTPRGKALRGLLSFAGKKNPDGSVNIKQSGSLLPLLQ